VVWYFLIFLLPAAIVGYLVLDHRRKAEQRAAASAERLNMILGATTHVPESAPDASAAGKTEPTVAAVPAQAPYVTRERILTPPQTLLYYLLKTALPEYHVFAQVTLRAFLDAAPSVTGYARNEQTRRLSWHSVDFLVCDRNLKAFAVVELARDDEPAATAGSRESWIGSAGLRYLAFEPNALPRKEALRALVMGDATQPGAATAGAAS